MVGDIIDRIKRGRNLCVMDQDLKVYHLGRIQPLMDKVNQLVTSGHQIELMKGVYPVTSPDTPEYRAILWRHIVDEGQQPEEWQLLVYEKEITGPEGPAGHEGEPGRGIQVHGTTSRQNNLTLRSTYTAAGIHTPVPGDVMVVNGTPNNAWMYMGPLDHKPAPGTEGWEYITNWNNLGPIAGIVGPKGPKGDRGPKGSSGGIGAFLLSWLASTVTNTAITVATQVANDEIMEGLNMMEDAIQSAAQTAVDEALEEMADEFKGDKGEKGDDGEKGEDGKDGTAFNFKGSAVTYPPPSLTPTVGDAWFIESGGEPYEGHIVVWGKKISVGGVGTEGWIDCGKIKGPAGENGKDAKWGVQLLDKLGANVGLPIEVKNSEDGVANFNIRGSENIKVEQLTGIQKGFVIKYEPKKEEEVIPTAIKIKNPTTHKVYSITVNTSGRLEVEEVING